MKTVQVQTEENEEFLQRVDRYQRMRGIKRLEACKEIGISEGRLSEIRNGLVSPSDKMWRRLEMAENDAGMSSGNEDRGAYGEPRSNMENPSDPIAQMRDDIAKLTACMEQVSKLSDTMDQMAREIRDLKMEVRTATRVSVSLGGGRDATEEEKRATTGS